MAYQVVPDTVTRHGDRYAEPLGVEPMTLPEVPPGWPYTLAFLPLLPDSVTTVPYPCSAVPGGTAIHALVPVAVQPEDDSVAPYQIWYMVSPVPAASGCWARAS